MSVVIANPKVLMWAREYHHLDLTDAAKSIGISPERLKKIENGEEHLNNSIFDGMVRVYRLPEATLLLKNVPHDAPKEPKSYRTVKGRPETLTRKSIIAIRKLRNQLLNLTELAEVDASYELASLVEINRMVSPFHWGTTIRKEIGPTIEKQLSWEDPDVAFRQWRRTIESMGIVVAIDSFPTTDCLALSIYDSGLPPGILLNSKDQISVQLIFSLAHELGHLLIRKPGLSDFDPHNNVEAYCNRFAASFLMPDESLELVLGPLTKNQSVEWDIEKIREAAWRLSVSQLALALRLEEAEYAPKGYFDWFQENQPKREKKKKDNDKEFRIKHAIMLRRQLGYHYTGTIISALDRGVITEFDATRYLNTSLKHITNLKELA